MAGMMGQFDLMFIDMMTPHHASAVAMAQVALPRAEHPELRALAEQIIESQSAEIEQMQTWRDEWFPGASAMPMENGPDGQMMGRNDGRDDGRDDGRHDGNTRRDARSGWHGHEHDDGHGAGDR